MKIYLISILSIFSANSAYAKDTTLSTIVNISASPTIDASNYFFAICSSNTGAFGHNCGPGVRLAIGQQSYSDSVPNSHNYLPSIEFPRDEIGTDPIAVVTLTGTCLTGKYAMGKKPLWSVAVGSLYEVTIPIPNPKDGSTHTYSMTATVTGFTKDPYLPVPEITVSECSYDNSPAS